MAVSILDPSGNQPSVRFAVNNYYNGGRHPIGRIGVNTDIDSFTVIEFDDIRGDDSLSYQK